jgi:LacI family transcriptional regulator
MVKRRRVALALELEWFYRYTLDVFAGAQEYARQCERWECVIDPYPELSMHAKGPARAYDGIIARATPALAAAARRAGVPLVNVRYDGPAIDAPLVVPDSEAGGRMAVEHLLARGFKTVSYIGYCARGDKVMLRGIREALTKAGFSCAKPLLVSERYAARPENWRKFSARLNEWMDGWSLPMGICAGYDLLARYVANACEHRGWNVPRDVALVGSCDEPLVCNHPNPSLTSIDFGYDRVGYRAAELLDEMMDGAPAPRQPVLVQPSALIPRQSTDALVVDDKTVAAALRFIAEHGHEPIRVSHVAKSLHLTRRTLERRFRAALRRSIADEIVRLRVERAKRRLAEDSTPFKRLAAELGFGDAERMCAVFKRVEGVTPRVYRRNHRRE